MACAFCGFSNEFMSTPKLPSHEDILLGLLLEDLQFFFFFTTRSMIHLEISFVHVVRWGLRFFFPHMYLVHNFLEKKFQSPPCDLVPGYHSNLISHTFATLLALAALVCLSATKKANHLRAFICAISFPGTVFFCLTYCLHGCLQYFLKEYACISLYHRGLLQFFYIKCPLPVILYPTILFFFTVGITIQLTIYLFIVGLHH